MGQKRLEYSEENCKGGTRRRTVDGAVVNEEWNVTLGADVRERQERCLMESGM